MTDEQINIKIAELCGWRKDSQNGFQPTWKNTDGTRYAESLLPNYAADLNACHEFEVKLKKFGVFSSYLSHLAIVCGFNAQGDEAWFKLHAGVEAVCSATASQKCEAFLRIHGQWEEQP